MTKICTYCQRPESEHTEANDYACPESALRELARLEVSQKLLDAQQVAQETLQQTFDGSVRLGVDQKAIEACRAFQDAKEKHLRIYGAYGTGKTGLSRAILNVAMELRQEVMEIKAIPLAQHLNSFKDWKLFETMKWVPVLLIDDLDKATWKIKPVQRLWEIMDARYDRKVKTIITMNMTPKQVQEKMKRECPEDPNLITSLWQRMQPAIRAELRGERLR